MWRKDVKELKRHERAFGYGILFIVFLTFFLGTAMVKAYAIDYSFTPKEYKRLLQDTCLMGQRVVDKQGEHLRAFQMFGPKLVHKEKGVIGQMEAWFAVNEAGNRAELYLVSVIVTKDKEKPFIATVFLIDNNLDGVPDLQGEKKSELGEVNSDGKELWNVWIVRFIERR